MLKNIRTVFFDYDGTIHESIKIYAPAFRKAYKFLVENQYAKDRQWSEKEMSYWLGFSSKDMWKEFMPDLDEEIRNKASKIIGEEMLQQLSDDKAILYQGAIDILQYLKDKGYKLIFISNCGIYYKEMARKTFNLDDYFEEMICSEEYDYIPKYQILSKIKDDFNEDMVIVGDRIQDIETGIKNNIYTIGCKYGYGNDNELNQANYIIENIMDIKKLL